jgi:predicted Zn finger-like uncharacterized protein
MYIACPSCSTSFNVDGANIGTDGRAVRCFNCNHAWHQYPVVHQPQPQYVPVQYIPPGQFAVPPQMAQPPAAPEPAPVAAPDPIAEPEPEPEPIPEPVPEPEPEPEPIPEEDLPSEEELDAMLGSTEEVEDISSEPEVDEAEEISLEDLEELEDPDPVETFTPDDADDLEDEDLDPDDIPDPDPIADPFDDEEDDEEEPKGGLVKTLIKVLIVLVIFGGLGTGAVFMRSIVVDLIPSTNIVFELIGLRVAIPGEGLRVDAGDPKIETIDGKEFVVIKGLVTNMSDVSQPIPKMFVRILDGNLVIVGVKTVIPEKKSLQPAEKIRFGARILYSTIPTGRTADVVWGPFQDEGDQDEGAPEKAPAKKAAPKKDAPK